MKKIVSLCALAALYAGPAFAETPAVKVETVSPPAVVSAEKAKEETSETKEIAKGSEAAPAPAAEAAKPVEEKAAEHTEKK